MDFKLIPLRKEHVQEFKRDMQEAFQTGAENAFAATEETVLPESHIDMSLEAKGSRAYEALVDGKLAGGAIVSIDEETQRNSLDFLYVKNGVQSKGVGQAIWSALEKLFLKTKVWETCTPYFEKRNIHFYVNCCGFHIVEFFNERHPDPKDPDGEYPPSEADEDFEGMFRFEKVMKG